MVKKWYYDNKAPFFSDQINPFGMPHITVTCGLHVAGSHLASAGKKKRGTTKDKDFVLVFFVQ